jgi:hypothetical protein
MDFLENLIKINNMITLQNLARDRNLNEEETYLFIQKYNKDNNRLFTPCKQYVIDEYKVTVDKYNQLSNSPSSSSSSS